MPALFPRSEEEIIVFEDFEDFQKLSPRRLFPLVPPTDPLLVSLIVGDEEENEASGKNEDSPGWRL
jgi:hypothetical protein